MQISPTHLFIFSILLRIGFFLFGLYQDAYLPVKYTDIDYLVFSDAAQYVSNGGSPYLRETYRYTPLLAWMLLPNSQPYLYSFGKFIFMISDLVTGWIIMKLLVQQKQLTSRKVLIFSSLWLLNPMVITISTRGSSESVLTVLIMTSIYLLLIKESLLGSAVFMGLAIHFKIYPIIYLPAIMLYLTAHPRSSTAESLISTRIPVICWIDWKNITYLVVTLITVTGLNAMMYFIYGFEFLEHSYLYHLTRVDHRHNFSIYNIAMYFQSANTVGIDSFSLEKLAFVPQFAISAVIIPLLFARENLVSCLFFQTFAFVIFNKVMTSQYFIWFLIFLPHYLSLSKLINLKGFGLLITWIITQTSWLFFAYKLEFLGESTFNYQLFAASAAFFLANCYILGELMESLS